MYKKDEVSSNSLQIFEMIYFKFNYCSLFFFTKIALQLIGILK